MTGYQSKKLLAQSRISEPDDLVKRLRDYINCRPWIEGRTFDATHPEVLIAQSAYRIEQLGFALQSSLDACKELDDRNKQLEAALRDAYKNCLDAVEKVKSDPFTELGVHQKSICGNTTAKDWMVAFAEDVEREIKARAALGEKKDD